MRSSVLLTLSISLAAASVTAQSAVTSPKGLASVEGNATFLHWGANRRFQQIDATHRGTPMVIKSLGFRRQGTGGGTNALARTFDMAIVMSHADFGRIDGTFDNNYLDAPVSVFTKKSVNFPDWTTAPVTPPAPFDFVVPFDSAWPYTGVNALLFDFTIENPSVTSGATMDRDFVSPASGTGVLIAGSGCTATGRTAVFAQTVSLENGGPALPNYGMRINFTATNAPAGAGVLAFVDVVDSNLTVPGLCTTLHALPTLLLVVGTASPTGALPEVSYSFPYDVSLQTGVLFSQLFALDAGQPGIPVVLSTARRSTMPSSTATTGHECMYHWATLPATSGSNTIGGGAVAQLGL
jgi:hypothetical protein